MNTLSAKITTTVLLTYLLSACGGGGGGSSDSGNDNGNPTPSDNNSPTISGTPNTVATSNSQYQFLPRAQDADNDILSFSITNKPAWANFDTTTGALSGTPTDSAIGNYTGITISVSDGEASADLNSFSISVTSGSSTTDTDGDGLSNDDERNIYGTNPEVSDTDGDGFFDKEEVENWDQNSGTHLRFNPLVADVPRLLTRQLGAPVIQLYATTTESNSFSQGMSNENEDEVVITTNRGRSNTNVVEEQHAVNVNAEVEKSGPVTKGSASASYDYQHTDTTTETNYWDEETVDSNRQTVSEYYDKLNSETVTEKGGEIKILLGLVNDGDISYTVSNMNVTAYIENPQKPGDLTSVGTLQYEGDMSFTPDPLGTTANPDDNDFTPFNFVYKADDNPEEISRILEQSNQLILKPVNISLTGQRADVDLNLAAQNIRARTAEIIIDYGDNPARKPERHRVAIDVGNGSTLSFSELMDNHLNYDFTFASADAIGANNAAHTGLTSLRNIELNGNTNSYWLVAHTFTPANNAGGATSTEMYNILDESYSADDIELRKGDVLHLVYIVDTDLDGLSDRLEVLKGTDIDLADTDADGIDDAQEVYGWYSNLDTPPCDSGDDLSLVFSNPLKADTDADGQTDGEERDNCANPQGDLSVDAGDNQITSQATRVSLTAQASNANTSSLRYEWTQTEGVSVGELPNRASIDIDVPDAVTSLRFEVSVTDTSQNNVSSIDDVQVLVVRDQDFALFIDLDNGHDFNNDGFSPDSPIRTLERAIANFTDYDIYLNNPNDGAIYALDETLVLSAETNLYGGFDDEWNHDPINAKTPITVNQAIAISAQDFIEKTISGVSIQANAPAGGTEHSKAIFAANSTGGGQLILSQVNAQGGDLNSGTLSTSDIAKYVAASSYGVFASNLDRVDIIDSTISAGEGTNGYKGVTGDQGEEGEAGVSRSGNDERGGGGGADHGGYNGGDGGTAVTGAVGCTAGKSGGAGKASGSISGGSGGAAGKAVSSFLKCELTGGGSGGSKSSTTATTGSQGTGADDLDNITAGYYLPSHGGTGGTGNGGAGGGGGGGGSGPGVNGDNGGGGGGGGEGGDGGDGGKGGRGAGGSFALALHQVEFTSISDTIINSKNGGAGGAGGNGGSGGEGGSGGSGGDSGGRKGGSGGKGGWGGRGGSGGGGTGGPVAGILLLDTTELEIENATITTGNAGSGVNPNAGQGGWNYGIYTDGSAYTLLEGNSFSIGNAGNGAPTAGESNQ